MNIASKADVQYCAVRKKAKKKKVWTAASMGKKGGKTFSKQLTEEQRKARAQAAAKARWGK